MKKKIKLTNKVANKLTHNSTFTIAKNTQDCVNIIVANAKLGFGSCFIDNNDVKTLTKFSKELTSRGFRTFVEETNGTKFLTVEW